MNEQSVLKGIIKEPDLKKHNHRMNQGLNKTGYKHTPLGWIPEEWEIKELNQVADIQQGVSKGKIIAPSDAIEISYLRVANVKDGYMDLQEIKKIIVEKSNYKRYLLQRDDILITEGGDPDKLGRGALWNEQVNCCIYQNHLFRIRAFKDVLLPIYFYNFLQGKRAKTYFLNCAKQTTGIASINSTQVKEAPVVLPPFSEQNRIAATLSIWDDAITKARQLITRLQQRNIELMQSLLEPKANWIEYRIGELLNEVKRPVTWNDDELYQLISVKRRSGGAFFRENLYGRQILTKQLFTAKEGDFLISKMQIVHGASAIVPAELDNMKISGSYIALHAKDSDKLDIHFFNWLSKTPNFYRLTFISSYGVHIEKMTFDFEDFKRRKIKLPPTLPEQRRIVDILKSASKEKALYEQQLKELTQQKRGLMQKLLTGELRVTPEPKPFS